jgi:hypothetical protein
MVSDPLDYLKRYSGPSGYGGASMVFWTTWKDLLGPLDYAESCLALDDTRIAGFLVVFS